MSLRLCHRPALKGLLALLLLAQANLVHSGAEARGVGNYYFKIAQASTEADRGFDNNGNGAPLASDVFLDDFTAGFARDGEYREKAYRIYLEYGVTERIDLLFSLEYKDIKETFETVPKGVELPFQTRVTREADGLADGMVGFKYQLKDTAFPIATDVRFVFPNYSTSVSHLNLETIDSTDDKVPLGDGTYNLEFGLGASVYPIPWTFADARAAFVLSDIDGREFSDKVRWELKAGGSYKGPGGAVFADGAISLNNGDAPNTISQDSLTIDPKNRVTVLNDQEFTRLGLQGWYYFNGVSLEATLSKVINGRNTTKDTSFEIAISFQQ